MAEGELDAGLELRRALGLVTSIASNDPSSAAASTTAATATRISTFYCSSINRRLHVDAAVTITHFQPLFRQFHLCIFLGRKLREPRRKFRGDPQSSHISTKQLHRGFHSTRAGFGNFCKGVMLCYKFQFHRHLLRRLGMQFSDFKFCCEQLIWSVHVSRSASRLRVIQVHLQCRRRGHHHCRCRCCGHHCRSHCRSDDTTRLCTQSSRYCYN
jgi:hypothetical protein